MVHITVNHTFLGGNNPRTETEELEGNLGETYKIRNRSNSAYAISTEGFNLLNGTFKEDTKININYESIPKDLTYTVYFIDDDTNMVLIDPETHIAKKGQEVTVVAPRVDGYITPEDQTIFMDEDKEVVFRYKKIGIPTSVELVPDTVRLQVGETATLGYKLLPEANYAIHSVEFEMVENENVAFIKDIVLTGREIGFGMVRGTIKGKDWELTADGAVMVSGAPEEGE